VPTDRGDDLVVREEPLLIEVGGQSVLTMRTPGHDADLALGFLLGEGILQGAAQVAGIDVIPRDCEDATHTVDVARVRVSEGVQLGPVARERLTRAHAIRASCGICGLASAEGLTRNLSPLPPSEPCVDLPMLTAMLDTMRSRQPLFDVTGGCHAAAVFPATGGPPWAVREDVGRHNALDKALGRCAADGRPLEQGVVLLSGRGGYELVLKALRLGVPVVASISAPSSLAVELAEEHGLTLVGFLRDGEGRVYADDGRVRGA
jgi:FdhD protein